MPKNKEFIFSVISLLPFELVTQKHLKYLFQFL